MSAAEARENLESVIWHERGGDRHIGANDVDRILAAADAYATARADEEAGKWRLAVAASECRFGKREVTDA